MNKEELLKRGTIKSLTPAKRKQQALKLIAINKRLYKFAVKEFPYDKKGSKLMINSLQSLNKIIHLYQIGENEDE